MPYPQTLPERLAGALVGLAVAGAGAWVLISPPLSYEGIGALLTNVWGALLATGGVLIATGWSMRSYKLELPGVTFALGGLAIYALLSWQQTLGESLGSGPRALLITAGAVIALLRLVRLAHTSRDARWIAEVRIE